MRFAFVTMLLVSTLSTSMRTARADTLSAIGGLSFGRNNGMNDLKAMNPLLGAEYTFDLVGRLKLGGFYDYTFLTDSNGNSGSLQFMGAVLRFDFANETSIGPFIDGKAGIGKREEGDQSSGARIAYGAGAGLRIPLSKTVSISPRFDIRYVPNAPDPSTGRQGLVDFGMMLSIHL
jgi:hypothetical protein